MSNVHLSEINRYSKTQQNTCISWYPFFHGSYEVEGVTLQAVRSGGNLDNL